mgnify:FL=1
MASVSLLPTIKTPFLHRVQEGTWYPLGDGQEIEVLISGGRFELDASCPAGAVERNPLAGHLAAQQQRRIRVVSPLAAEPYR